MARNEKISIRDRNVEKVLKDISKWEIDEKNKKDLLIFFNDLRIGKITGNQITEGTLMPYISNLRISLEFFKKPVSKITPKDTENLSEALLRNKLQRKIKRKVGDEVKEFREPFVETGKIKIKNILIKYLEWKLKDRAEKLTKILKVKPRLKEPTIDYLKEEEVEKLFKACKNAEEKYLISVLFCSGARAEEFHNIRKEDIEEPKGDGFVKLTLKEEYSKTKGRVISLFWRHTREAVHDYLQERIAEGIKSDEAVFKKNYKSTRKFLERLGKKVLGRSIHYHLFRHTSATYYANKMNRQQLCIRYGWRFRSPMPDRYINRLGMQDKELDEKFQAGTIKILKDKLENAERKMKIREEEFDIKMEKMENKSQDTNKLLFAIAKQLNSSNNQSKEDLAKLLKDLN